jgi:alginate O-acetyltransferase complex protein AlgI
MLFNSFIFLLFLGIVLPVHRILPWRYRNLFLVAASYFFYGYWDWRFLFLILASTALDFFVGSAIYGTVNQHRRKLLLLFSVAGNLSILGFFKYYNFFVDSFVDLASIFGFHPDFVHLNIILPVGISFYTFQTMSYTIDIYRKKFAPTRSFVDFALFVAFFPQLVSGPIERAAHLLPQIEKRPVATKQDFDQGFALMTTGFFKKVMIGDTCGRIVDQVFADPKLFSSPVLLMGLMLFAVQIYADFSGYTNIARGTARFFGIDVMVNFNQPYLSPNITELWRRWHISLMRWMRDYVYISLGGNRKGAARTYLNIMVTWMLVGLWHGATWTFVVWGALQGFLLCVHRLMLRGGKVRTGFGFGGAGVLPIYVLKAAGTHLLFLVGLVFFRIHSFDSAWYTLKKLVMWEHGDFTGRVIVVIATYYFVTIALDLIEYWTKDHAYMVKVNPAYRNGVYAATFLVTLIYMFQAPVYPFVYFQF